MHLSYKARHISIVQVQRLTQTLDHVQKLKVHVCICAYMCAWLCAHCAEKQVLTQPHLPPLLCLPRRVNGAPVHWGIMALAIWHVAHYMYANTVCTLVVYISLVTLTGIYLCIAHMPSLELDLSCEYFVTNDSICTHFAFRSSIVNFILGIA